MARKFEVEKNREPLFWAIGLLVVAVWCFKDGWFPTESILEKYPETPDSPWSLGLQFEYYRFNRVTALLSGIASGVMACVYVVINRP